MITDFGKLALVALAATSIVLGAPTADAAPSTTEQRNLKKYLNSAAYVNKLRFIVSRYEASVNGCKAPKVAGRVTAKLLKTRVAMPGIGVPTSTQWVDIVRVEGCGKPFRRKVIAAQHKGQAVMFPYLRGSTRTTPKLQFDTMKLVLSAARQRSKKAGCKKKSLLAISTSKFVAEAKVEHGTMWRETWTVKSCKGHRKIGILFAPNQDGKITVSLE